MTVQVLPFSFTEHAGSEGPVTILKFAEEPTVAVAEGRGSGRMIEQGQELSHVSFTYDRLRAAALSPEESVGMIYAAMENVWIHRRH